MPRSVWIAFFFEIGHKKGLIFTHAERAELNKIVKNRARPYTWLADSKWERNE